MNRGVSCEKAMCGGLGRGILSLETAERNWNKRNKKQNLKSRNINQE